MGKIGFMQYFDNDDDDKKQKRPAKAAASETEDGAWFRKYFTENYATHGGPDAEHRADDAQNGRQCDALSYADVFRRRKYARHKGGDAVVTVRH